MKAVTFISSQGKDCRQSVKKQLIMVIICLTSEKLLTFATVVCSLMAWIGALSDNEHIISSGTLVYIIFFGAWSWRQTRRDIRQGKLGLKKW